VVVAVPAVEEAADDPVDAVPAVLLELELELEPVPVPVPVAEVVDVVVAGGGGGGAGVTFGVARGAVNDT